MKVQFKILVVFVILIFLQACATFKPQYKNEVHTEQFPDKQIAHSFYLIGDAGNSPIGTSSVALEAFKVELEKASKNSTAIFLGDNIYQRGMPKKDDESRGFAEHQLNIQTSAVEDFKGETIFIPGNHDWYSNGLKGLKRQEKYIEDKLGKHAFLPENGCPLEKVNISESIVMIVIDSEWYLTNWDKHPTMNDECEIKTREKFFDELEGEIKKARGKTTIIAIHHPMFTNGSHGGQYSFASHMKPLPVLGTLKNVIRKTGGVITVDMQNQRYNDFRKRVITLSQENDKTIFVSGHDHNLQYIVEDNLPQIISGSGSKAMATRNKDEGLFSYGTPGYARLDVFEDGSSFVRFYSASDEKIVFQSEVLEAEPLEMSLNFNDNIDRYASASIYSEEETTKGKTYKYLWGDRYREDFSKEVSARTVRLDTLFGGLNPVRKGGGHQSKSLRLEDKDGREYVMRALRKNALQYLQAVGFKDQYIEGQFDDTFTEGLLLDAFTGSHPYAPFVVGTLSDAAGVFHTNPTLYYIPKQETLGQFNDEFGDELYMIEERAADGHGDKASFGFSDKLISTDDLMKELSKDEDIVLDEPAYIRARLFDMLIGDWDRHDDQWRWAKFKENKKTIYRPMPRDRDMAFSTMTDGFLFDLATALVPSIRLMKSYDVQLKDVKWFNMEPYPLDMAFISQSGKSVWDAQVNHIVTNITEAVIDNAFSGFPSEINQETIAVIKQKLLGRLSNLQDISDRYYAHVNKFAVIKGTHKDDYFEIERINNETRVTVFRIKNGEKSDIIHQRTYSKEYTREIWVYGLDDDDVFVVSGEGSDLIKVRIIGGQNKDTYNIQNGKKVKTYDFKKKENIYVTNNGAKKLTDNYETNVYDYKKFLNSGHSIIPTIGSNPDDGLKLGVNTTFTAYGFERNPFTSQHMVSAAYYFATNGFDFSYSGEFANVIGEGNLMLKARFTSPNYSVNFFGFGNETLNPEADEEDGLEVDLDYNRVKLSTIAFEPTVMWRGDLGSKTQFGLSYESIEIEETSGRYINQFIGDNEEVNNDYIGVNAGYNFESRDNDAYPTLGLEFNLQIGYKSNIDESKGFGYVIPELVIDHKLSADGQLVLATKLASHINIGDDFEFYQAATIGANNGLRGYRNERFSGKSAFVQSTDLRLNLSKVKTSLIPLDIGIYGGFDYGRVWMDGEDSDTWNNSLGGGIFANALDIFVLNLSAFNSDDGLRMAFKVGFGF
ncbi:phosphoesterase [Flavobacteriales bacterium 34_180_T64]|nr:phosphoesterase [Flavobacteriales bacterium 34_180_T64]